MLPITIYEERYEISSFADLLALCESFTAMDVINALQGAFANDQALPDTLLENDPSPITASEALSHIITNYSHAIYGFINKIQALALDHLEAQRIKNKIPTHIHDELLQIGKRYIEQSAQAFSVYSNENEIRFSMQTYLHLRWLYNVDELA